MIIISILTLIVAKALPVLNNQISTVQFTRISSLVLIFSALLSIQSLHIYNIGSGIGMYSGLFHITQISVLFDIFIFIIGAFILIGWPLITRDRISLLSINKLNTVYGRGREYSLIILFSILGSSLLISSLDLISVYLSLELQSFGLYVLASLHRTSETSSASGLKYFLLGGLSSCIILLGICIIYAYSGLTNLESLYLIKGSINIIGGISLGIILIVIGLLFKIGAAPLHNWSPDVYDGTPTIVTTYLTIIPKISILILILELVSQLGLVGTLNYNLIISPTGLLSYSNGLSYPSLSLIVNMLPLIGHGDNLTYLLLLSSFISLIVGSLLGLAQIKLKRLLAYSTISHLGFILLALSINTSQSIDSLIFYIIQYTLTNLNIFLILLAYSYLRINKGVGVLSDINYINELLGFFYTYPLLSLSLSICLFSMAGIPPLLGFFSKQFVLYAALQNGYYLISIIGIIVSVISASYYLKIVKLIMSRESNPTKDTSYSLPLVLVSPTKGEQFMGKGDYLYNINTKNLNYLSNVHTFIISSLTLFILLFFINPSILLNSTQLLSLSLFYL